MDEQHARTEGDPPDPSESPDGTAGQEPEFGPSGYLPDRASRRARKIILRAPLGLQWVIGSLVVGLVVVGAGWFALRDTAPTDPFVEVPGIIGGSSVTIEPALDLAATDAGGRPRAFVWANPDEPLTYCQESGLLESTDDRAWRVTGRGVGGTPSLVPYRTAIHDGAFYVDPTTTLEPLTPDPDPAETACAP